MRMLSTSDLEVLRNNSLFDLDTALRTIRSRDAKESNSSAYFHAAYAYRALAVCELLLEANQARFFEFLCKAGQVRLHFLQLIAAGYPSKPDHLCTSRNIPFIDVLAAGDLDTAVALGELTPKQHNPIIEYEDDFLRYHFLHMLTLNQCASKNANLKSILERWEEVLEGGTDRYLDVCKTLFSADSDEFYLTFQQLIAYRIEVVEEWKKDFSFDPDVRLTESFIFMNGIAILRLAELLGMHTKDEYDMIPSLSRIPLGFIPPPKDSWRDPEEGMP